MKGLTSTFIAYYETQTELTGNPFIQYSNIHNVYCKSGTCCMYAWEFHVASLFHFILFWIFCCLLKSSVFAGLVFFSFLLQNANIRNNTKKCIQRWISHNKCVIRGCKKNKQKSVMCWWDENWNTEQRLLPFFLCIYSWVHGNILNKTQQSQHLNPKKRLWRPKKI